mgnify:CR=1 FL=1
MTDPMQTLVRADIEASPLVSLRSISAQAFRNAEAPHRRIGAAIRALVTWPEKTEAAELYLRELLSFTARLIDSRLSLGPTFSRSVKELDQDVRKALPEHSLAGLEALARLAPLPLPDPHEMAHALTLEDGRLIAWLTGERGAKPVQTEDVRTVFRQLASKYHPDRKQGNAQVMADLNKLYGAMK